MDELATTDINPDVPYFTACFEEYQVAKFEVFLGDILSMLCEECCRPWNCSGENISISNLHESRAINATFVVASEPVGGSLPAAEVFSQPFLGAGLFGSFREQGTVFRDGGVTFSC